MHCKSTAYHPQSDRQTERMNKVLEDMIRHYISPQQDNWEELLHMAEFAINNSYQSSIGNTPFYLNFGRHPRLPTDCNLINKPSKDPSAADYIGNIQKAIVKAKKCLQAAQQRQKKYADQHRTERHVQVGDMVWLNSRHIRSKQWVSASSYRFDLAHFRSWQKSLQSTIHWKPQHTTTFTPHSMSACCALYMTTVSALASLPS